ncbi:hypothetical protein A2311_00545 [candidate division WOR-1 bacterium RIFOXYB2_FULL_48_7]|uniref:Uncharacterized protein n=1 Tax=candidate division WOR-1 bacterium RIFOXYB2_FULL_48_7 TaxID=1802583 RepID=A0A1F4TU09_UNCSA|nr:MAG: hypothetical protein A2311_00545 [candidate division WOR-1 bacterium RIFOXYB2_FULL_48_7]
MRVTLDHKTLASFGINQRSAIRKQAFALNVRDCASLLLASFLVWNNLVHRRTFQNVSSLGLIPELERSISANNAFDANRGEFKTEAIEDLAATIGTIQILPIIFINNQPIGYIIKIAHQAIAEARQAGCSPYAAVQRLIENTWFIRNSHNESFGRVWQRRIAAYDLGSTTDPRNWPIDRDERPVANELGIMDISELEQEFIRLISGGPRPIMESSKEYLKLTFPLRGFIDMLSLHYGEMDHHFRSPIGRLVVLKSALDLMGESQLDKDEMTRYEELISKAYRYKAFIRELIKRWL